MGDSKPFHKASPLRGFTTANNYKAPAIISALKGTELSPGWLKQSEGREAKPAGFEVVTI